ncbi:unnamed protein product, partial [Durusdinium trenchii]
MEEASVSSSSPRKGLLEYKEELLEQDQPKILRQHSGLSSLSEDYPLELEEVKKQLSEAQEAASEAQARAKTVEEQRAKEAQEQHARKERTRKLLEEKLSATRRGVKPTTNVPELAEVKRQLSEAQELATEA